ncbi:MAG TPA: DinB family protein, partial [Fimbriimonadaceae bacterium]|nr:DinB family protein [Fimbriimonadaceae bacterium]
MSTLTPLVEAWDEAHREFAIALNGVPDADLWKRAHPRLLSVGELAAHVAYWQAVWALGGGNANPDLATLPIQSPLLDAAARYYTTNVDHAFVAPLGTSQVLAEVARIHEAAKAVAAAHEKDDPYPGQWGTWGNLVQYQAFHVAYHTGQAYSV